MFKKLSFFVLFLFICLNVGNTKLIVKEWHQENILDNTGQIIDIKLLLKAKDLQEGYYYNNWTYKFPENMDVEFIAGEVLNSNDSKINFNNNELKFNFKKTFNNGEIFLAFKYRINNKDNLKYIRREYISVPPFAVGARATINVNTDQLSNMIIYSNNDIFKSEDNKNIWIGIVPKEGFVETIELTKKKARWLLNTNINISSTKNIGDLNAKLPLFYVGGGNNVMNLKISSSQTPNIDYKNIKYDENFIYVNFNQYNNTEASIAIEGIVENSYNTKKYWLNELDPIKLIEIDAETSLIMNNVINIIRNNNINNDPIHIAIAKWVYNNITYNIDLVNENMTSKETLLRKEGVCEHMAVLYRDMLRSINIPATAVDGLAYDTKNGVFEGHSWVLVYYNGEWIPIDPTWNIYSGKLPISHIFFYKNTDTNLSFSKEGTFNNFKIDVIRNAKFIE